MKGETDIRSLALSTQNIDWSELIVQKKEP